MRIDEIIEKSFIVAKHGDFHVVLNNDVFLIYLGIMKDDDLISYMSIVKPDDEFNFHRIGLTATDRKYRQQGWIRCLIDWFTSNIASLVSDNIHTPEAKNMWKALIARPGNLKIHQLNISTGEKSSIDNPWDDNEDTFLIAEERQLFKNDRDIRHRTLSERAIIWYGIGTGSDEYPNP